MLQQQEVLTLARGFLQEKKYKHLRNFIKAHHHVCETDEVRLQLLRLWEESLYLEFSESRQDSSAGSGSSPATLSSSMRYKLRKKFPCPVELDQELRVKNARLPKPVHDGLNNWLKENRENPYPNKREKENLASKLGITPQQVNRWFIQRRKMLRIRGRLYLGRNVKVDEDEDDDDEMEFKEENHEYSSAHKSFMSNDSEPVPVPIHESAAGTLSMVALSPAHQPQPQDTVILLGRPVDGHAHGHTHDVHHVSKSLLEAILTCPRNAVSPSLQQQQTLCSGGSVEVMDARSHGNSSGNAMDDGHFPLTPPPSISGDSNARLTPPEMFACSASSDWSGFDHGEVLDLSVKSNGGNGHKPSPHHPHHSKSSPVILEPVSPPWRRPGSSSGVASACASPSGAFYFKTDSGSNFYEDDSSNCSRYSTEEPRGGGPSSSSCGMTQANDSLPMDVAEQLAVRALLSLAHSH